MKKFAVFLMMFALLLSAACGKDPVEPPVQQDPPVQEQSPTPEAPETPEVPQTPETPETPEVPQTPETPETPPVPEVPESPVAPETPVTPEVPAEPAGAVTQASLPEAIADSTGVDCLVPLEGGIVALRSFNSDGKPELVIYDLENNSVLSRQEVPGHDGTNELILKDTNPYTLRYYDGQDYWEIMLGEIWQQTHEEYDPALHLGVMGDLMIHQQEDSISVGRVVPPALQASDRMAYQFVRVLNEHQLLYYAADKSISSLSHFGVYDHNTDETRAVTTMGQTVVGTWGDILLVARNDNGWRYEFATVSLEDYTYTPLEIGHETAETGINGTRYGDEAYIQCDPESRRLLLVGDKEGTRTAEVVSLETGAVLYTIERPTEEYWRFYLAQDNRLLVRMGETDDSALWLVEYSVLPENAVPLAAEWEPPQQESDISWSWPTQWQMGKHTVTWEDHAILVDGTAVLDGDYRVQEAACAEGLSYSVRAILDDHRILYACGGSLTIDHIGIYDHKTGEDQIFAGENSVVRQLEEERLLFYYSDHGVMNADGYDFFLVHLENYDIQPLETGHDGWENKTDWVTFNEENTRLCLVTGGAVQVFDLQSGEEVFRWQGSSGDSITAWPDGEAAVVIGLADALWKVEY